MAETLKFRSIVRGQVEVGARLDDAQLRAGEFLVGRRVWLEEGLELRQHRAVSGPHLEEGYERLDNEILAGRRLHEAAGTVGYPREVACLHGDDADDRDPFALFEWYRGEPLREVCTNLLEEEKEEFHLSLLRGLCWLAAAGIAHRGIGPDTVLWDSQLHCAQIVDFSRCTVFGVARTPVRGPAAWVPEEQRPGTAHGRVGPRDDIWAAGQLIFYAFTQGEEYVHPDQLTASGLDGLLIRVLGRALGPAEARPAASELLTLLGRPDPAPQGFTAGGRLDDGRARFLAARARKHPDAPIPPKFNEDLGWVPDASGATPLPASVPLGPPPVPPADPAGPPSGEPADTGRPADTPPGPQQTGPQRKTRRFRLRRGAG